MKLKTTLTLAAATLLLAACDQSNNAKNDAPKAEKKATNNTFVYCTQKPPLGFSPALVMEGTSYNASSQQVYNRLVEFKKGSTEIEPALAESWDISDDGLTYTFHLRKGVKFHTTKEFTPSREFNADDVIFSFERQLDPNHPYHNVSKGTYPYFNAMKFPKLLKSVEKVDDNTVKITLNQKDATFLASLGMDFISIYSAEYADKMMKAGTPEVIDNKPVGTGPFVFVDYKTDQAAQYVAFDDYWKGRTPLDRLVITIVPDATTRYAKLQAGSCDLILFPNVADLAKMKTDPKVQLLEQKGLNVAYIAFNNEKPPFDNVKVRQALNYAVDKKAIIDAVYQGGGTAAKNPLPPTIWSYNDEIQEYPYDPEKAKQLLAEAGYPNGFETDFWIQPVIRSSNPNPKRLAELVMADWAKVGVKANPVTFEWADYQKRAKAGELTAGIFGWSGDNGDPDNFLSPLLASSNIGNSNYARFSNPEFDALLTKAIGLTDKAQRSELYKQAQVIFHEQSPWIPVAHSVGFAPLSKRVKGYVQSPFGYDAFYGVSVDGEAAK